MVSQDRVIAAMKQSHCSYSCTQNIQNSFALLLEVNIAD